jgi:uncharacterized protein (DUF885 family)
LLALALGEWPSRAAEPAKPQDLAARRKALERLVQEQWEYSLSRSPETASAMGDRRWNDKLADVSEKGIAEDQQQTRRFLERLTAIDTAGFPEQEALTKKFLARRLEEILENDRLGAWEIPVTPYSGAPWQVLEMIERLPFQTVKDYDDYIARLKQLPRLIDDTVAAMRKGMADHLVPPKYLLEQMAIRAEGAASLPPEKTRFAGPLEILPLLFSESDRNRIRETVISTIGSAVQPAYRRFALFVRNEYAPAGRAEPGMWSLPDGDARYASAVRHWTTTRYTPEEIHQLGLALVGQLETQIAAIARKAGVGDSKALQESIEKDPKLRPRSAEDILSRYRNFIIGMGTILPSIFTQRPKAGLTVASVEAARRDVAPAAEYRPGSPDGRTLATLVVNPASPRHQRTLSIETIAYHEGVPGHHMQIGTSQEMTWLPPQRRQARFAAFSEGWAMYAERLGKDVGFFTDPYSDYGRVREELVRSARLVADTGLHAKRWTRDQAIQYLRDRGGLPAADAQLEVDRMVYQPAEALGAQVGALKMLQLRERARKELGPKFRLASFHDRVLGSGPLPLDLLEERVDGWIEAEKAASSRPTPPPTPVRHRG